MDCTGDGAAAAFAGAQLLEEPGYCQYPSMLFHLSEVNWETAAAISRENLTAISQKAVERRLYDLPRVDGGVVPLPRPGEARCNLTRLVFQGRPLNPMDREEISWGEMEGRRQAYLYDFLRNQVPGYEMAKVSRLPEFVGVRESRRIRGRYVLTEEDVCGGRKFADGILSCAWPIELHALGSTTHWNALAEGDYYQIPLRSLMAQGFINLYMAGTLSFRYPQCLGGGTDLCCGHGQRGKQRAWLPVWLLSQGCPETEEKQKKVKERLIAAGAWLGEKMGEEA